MSESEFDPELWFTMGACCDGRHYLLYNPHTFPGRMGAWCPLKQVSFCVSKSEIHECSQAARYWIKGFLSGNEPDAPMNKKRDYLPDDHPRTQAWRAAIRQFPETGIWVVSERLCKNCKQRLLPTQPGLLCPNCANSSS